MLRSHASHRRGALGLSGVAVILLAVALTACGSRLTTDELLAGAGGPVGGPNASSVGAEGSTVGAGADPTGRGGRGGSVAPGDAGTVAAGTAGPRAGGSAPSKSEILLGSVGTGSGIVGAALRSVPTAVRAWVADVNARGGLDGHPVRVIFGDDAGDPGKALAIVRRMVEENRVLALMGSFATTTSHAFIPYLEQRGVPMVGNTGSPSDDASPMVFNPQASSRGNQLSIVTSIVAQTRARKIALVFCRESSSCNAGAGWIREYAPTIGVQIVYEAQISLAQPDFTAEMIGARNAGAEAVAIIADGNSMARVARSAHRQGWRPFLSGGIGLNDLEVVAAGGEDLEGFLGSSNVAPFAVAPQMRPYLAAVRRYVPGGSVAGPGSAAWVQGKLWERIAPLLGERPTARRVIDGLYSLRAEPLGGLVPPLTFPRGAHGSMNPCTVPVRVSGGKIVAPLGSDHFVCATDDGLRVR